MMRLCSWYSEFQKMNGIPEIFVENPHFKGWKIRYFRTANNDILKEYISHGEVVDHDWFDENDNYQLMMGMLQSDEWEQC